MPKKILCALDGSQASDRAAACAVELAKETGAKLTFAHVNTVPQDRIAKTWFWDQTLLSAVNDEIQYNWPKAKRSRPATGSWISAASTWPAIGSLPFSLPRKQKSDLTVIEIRSDRRPGTAFPRLGRHGSCIGGSLPRDDRSRRLTAGARETLPSTDAGRHPTPAGSALSPPRTRHIRIFPEPIALRQHRSDKIGLTEREGFLAHPNGPST